MTTFTTSIKYTLLLSFIFLAILITALWHLANGLVEPDRRLLQNYHLEWLKTPNLHGIKVTANDCKIAKTTCLFVEPDDKKGVAKRGAILRQQLKQANVTVKPYGSTQGVLVLLHGRNGRKEDLLPVAERFVAAGFQCVLADLPAHADHPQTYIQYATGKDEKDFANHVLTDARHFFIDTNSSNNKKAGIWGMSLGGVYAIDSIASKPENWKALVIVASFDSLEGIIDDKIRKLPSFSQASVRLIFKRILAFQGKIDLKKIQPIQWAKNIQLPVLVTHGMDDDLISLQRGKHLFDAFSSQQKQWIAVPNGTHQNILITPMPLYQSMSQWFLRFVHD